MKQTETFNIHPIGVINSQLTRLEDCPVQEAENAPDAYVELHQPYITGIKDIAVGDKLILFTWLHQADRTVVECHKRSLVGSKQFGVFSTRSPDRPNPIGIHFVSVMKVEENKIKIFPLEVLNGTPVIDIKPLS